MEPARVNGMCCSSSLVYEVEELPGCSLSVHHDLNEIPGTRVRTKWVAFGMALLGILVEDA